MTIACEHWSTTNLAWETAADPPIGTCDSTGLSLYVANGDAGSFRPSTTEKYRVVYTSDYSTHENKIFYDEFNLKVVDTC